MPRNTSLDRLRLDLVATLGPTLEKMNTAFHRQIRDNVHLINEHYLHVRNAALATSQDTKYPIGLYLCYESTTEKHTGLEIGYIRWRYGRSSTNVSQRNARRHPITQRVRRNDRSQIHYTLSDFVRVPRWERAPRWEQRLVMYTEQKVRPMREVLQEHKKAQRMFLHSPSVPDIDPSFDEFIL